MRKFAIGDLVSMSCFLREHPVDDRAVSKLSGLVCEVNDPNVYEPAEAKVYFGCLEVFEWYPVRSLSLVPDEER